MNPSLSQLKPRSVRPIDDTNASRPATTSSGKANPFGAAKPREQVLQQRGVDVGQLDSKFERKARVHHYSMEQERQLEEVREELSRLEELWRGWRAGQVGGSTRAWRARSYD